MAQPYKQWKKLDYVVSTDPDRINLESLRAAWALDMCYWAKPLDLDAMKTLVYNSICFGLYPADYFEKQNQPELIGFARGVTDFVTFFYLTDVYVLPEHQGKGAGKFLIETVNEMIRSMPDLRRAVLLTSGQKAISSYERSLSMNLVASPLTVMEWKGPGNVL